MAVPDFGGLLEMEMAEEEAVIHCHTVGQRTQQPPSEAVIHCHTVGQWTQQLEQAKQNKKLVVIDFTATWCGPCRMVAPIFAELAKEYVNVIFLKVDVDELKSVAEDWEINAMPTFIFMKGGTVLEKFAGAPNKDKLLKKIELFLSK